MLMKKLESPMKSLPLCLWEEKLLFSKSDEKKMLKLLQEAKKTMKANDLLFLYNLALDNVTSDVTVSYLIQCFGKPREYLKE